MKNLLALFAAVATGVASGANTWWVDCQSAAASHTGAEDAPYLTIQDAIDSDSTKAGDTIMVRPGVYTSGTWQGSQDGENLSRVGVTKTLRIESTGGAEVTHIVGASDPTAAARLGVGENAMRCVTVHSTAKDTVIKGFTIRDGRSKDGDFSGWTHGGGILSNVKSENGHYPVYVVDCVISNCVATRGGGAYHVMAIRTLFIHNHTNGAGGSAARQCDLYASIFAYNGHKNYVSASAAAAIDVFNCSQCTFFDNAPYSIYEDVGFSPKIHNCLMAREQNDRKSVYISNQIKDTDTTTLRHCVYTGVESAIAGKETTNFFTDEATKVSADEFGPLVSPYERDWRPITGGLCDGTGDPALAAPEWVPAEFRGKDFYGQPFVTDGKVNVGAVAAVGPKPQGGVSQFAPDFFNSGLLSVAGVEGPVNYTGKHPFVRRTTWPSQVMIDASEKIFRLERSNACGYVYPDLERKICLTIPPPGYVITNYLKKCTHETYADAENGNDEWDGSAPTHEDDTSKGPKQSLQAAVDAVPAGTANYGVVHVAPGVYSNGEKTVFSVPTRVAIQNRNVVLRGAGAAVTTIKGRRDTTTAANEHGCGPNAVRCVAFDRKNSTTQTSVHDGAVIGFTLTDGCVQSGGANDVAHQGGAYYCSARSYNNPLVQCVVTNCAGSRGGAVYGGAAYRTLFVDNEGSSQAQSVARCGFFASCVFRHNGKDSNLSQVIASDYSVASHCTFVDHKAPALYVGQVQAWPINCAVSGTLTFDLTNRYYGCYQCTTPSETRFTYVEPPMLADVDGGDLHPLAGPLVGGGSTCDATMYPGVNQNADLVYTLITGLDFEGCPLRVVGGRPTVGAYQTPVDVFRVSAAQPGDLAGDSVGVGNQIVKRGETMTVKAAGNRNGREYRGILVNGELAVEAPVVEWSYTADGEPSNTPVDVRVVYNTDWYVNPAGDDAKDGWTRGTAKKTLVEAVRCAIAGDTVHLAPGTYAEKTMSDGCASNSMQVRVQVPAGVTLEGDDRDTVIIKGERNGDKYSSTNVRCVRLNRGAALKNLTVSTGSVTNDVAANNGYAGGVFGAAWAECLVENCVITNCFGSRGGAGHSVTFRNCRIVGNGGSNGSAGRECAFENCFIDDNLGTQVILMHYGIVNCYYGPNNYTGIQNGCKPPNRVINSVFLWKGQYGASNAVNDALTNNVFVAGSTISKKEKCTECNVVFTNVEAIALGPDGVPQTGSCLIDAGILDASVKAAVGDVDCLGGQRIYNGKIDIGCCEYDWRGRYTADMETPGLRVTKADSEVVEADGRVYLPSGEVGVVWSDAAGKSRRLTAEVTGNGQLFMYVGDAEKPELVWSAGGPTTYKWRSAVADAALRFVYEPGLDDVGGAYLLPFEGSRGMALLIR